jgi:pimeloyl-ACP methyl ester carboxylesterase
VVLLGHGWPYSPYAYAEVAPALAKRGYRVLVPYLRGNGPTVFRSADTIRSGQQAALGADVIAFMDALGIRDAIFAGCDWGGRGLCVAAALWPERADGVIPPTDGSSSAQYFAGPRVHHRVAGAGHNLPQEQPRAFTATVLEVAGLR